MHRPNKKRTESIKDHQKYRQNSELNKKEFIDSRRERLKVGIR
jgi:hypothetical protein